MFATHKLNDTGFEEMKVFKSTLAKAVNDVLAMMPEGREKSLFATKIEEAVYYGATAIAKKPTNFLEKTDY